MVNFTDEKGKKKLKKIETSESEEEEGDEDDKEKLREEFIDLIDDSSFGEESDGEKKRKNSNSENSDDYLDLDADDYDLIEENLGVKVQRKKYKRLKRVTEDSEDEEEDKKEKEAIANELFSHDVESSNEDEISDLVIQEAEQDNEESSANESDCDDFIVYEKTTIKKPIINVFSKGVERKKLITDSALQEAHEIFGTDVEEIQIAKENATKKRISEIYDRTELKYSYLTDNDKEICKKDIPERMQLRPVPVTSATEEELAKEAQWICEQAEIGRDKGLQTVAKIKKSLDLIRNQNFEVPFISFYRKEYVSGLSITDLWKIYKFDVKWCQLQERKEKLLILYKNIKCKQEEHIKQHPDAPFPDNSRLIEEEDLNQLQKVQTMDELNDYFKQTARNASFSLFRKAGLDSLAKKFGLSPQHFAKNLSEWYQIYEVEQESDEPSVVAAQYIGRHFKTVDDVLRAAQLMVAIQIAKEPLVRELLRKMYREKATLSVQPTKKGIRVIDEYHLLYTMKYLKDKPVQKLEGDQYLKLVMAEEDNLIKINFSDVIGHTYEYNIDKIKYLYYRDEDSKVTEEWNALRLNSIEIALTKMIIPDLQKELHLLLLSQAKDYVMSVCARKVYDWIKISPYTCEYPEENNEEWDTSKGLRVMGLALVPDFSEAAYACLVAPDGGCTSFIKLAHLIKKYKDITEVDKKLKQNDLLALRKFIAAKKPHVVVVGGESTDALIVANNVKEVIADLVADDKTPDINVQFMDNDFAKVYARSHQGASEFKDYPEMLRQAISLARRLQDPLVEFSQLCNADKEILCLNLHSLKMQLSREDLLENIYVEFINLVNEVGVDLNKIMRRSHAANLVQFICGLGPRKGRHLIRVIKQMDERLEQRKQLITSCHMGPKVFVNCAGFIKIDINNLDGSADTFIKVLEATRIHPETYEWAIKMAADALEYNQDDDKDDALEEILESPEKLFEFDLDAFADELERRGYGNKSITLNEIRTELISRYKDPRIPYVEPTQEELLFMFTQETPETLCVGKLLEATVTSINYRKTAVDQLVQESFPQHNEVDDLWQCPLCQKFDFPKLQEVWKHIDSVDCPGKILGFRLRFDNGLFGYIQLSNLSDERVENPLEIVWIGKRILCRVIKIEADRLSLVATCKNSDITDINQEWRPQKDSYYDTEAEAKDGLVKEPKKVTPPNSYLPRFILHPSFRNITFAQAETLMQSMMPGEIVIRPSSKGDDHLTASWKVTDGIYKHIDIQEEGKLNQQSLGQSLWIGDVEYEDLDEIIARHMIPMAEYATELLNFKYYKPEVLGVKEKAEEILREQREENPNVIPYIVSASKKYPGSFLLSYLPNTQCGHEYIHISQNGFNLRGNSFCSLYDLFNWHKEHFKDPIPENGLAVQEPSSTDAAITVAF